MPEQKRMSIPEALQLLALRWSVGVILIGAMSLVLWGLAPRLVGVCALILVGMWTLLLLFAVWMLTGSKRLNPGMIAYALILCLSLLLTALSSLILN